MWKVIKGLCAVTIGLCSLPGAIAQTCEPVSARGISGGIKGEVPAIGRYCLNVDLHQPQTFDIHAMGMKTYQGAALLSIAPAEFGAPPSAFMERGLDIHLQGHELKATAKNMIGIKANTEIQSVHVHDGTIIVPGALEPNIGIDLHMLQSPRTTYARLPCDEPDVKCSHGAAWGVRSKAPPYAATRHTVSKVNIRAGWLGVQLVGHGNTIRNSVIEVDSRNAIALFGSGGTLENNTIIVHGEGAASPNDGAITLWDGDGTVIRHNRFIFKAWFRDAPPAIRLIDSSNVKLEGNTFEGYSQIVQQSGRSSFSNK